MRRSLSILKDTYTSMSLGEFVAFVWRSLFKEETVVIYCRWLRDSDMIGDHQGGSPPVVRGKLEDLKGVRSQIETVPWEFKCDVYDGVKDFFWYQDARSGTIGHISWLYYKGDPNRTLRLGDNDCEIMFCLTAPEYRGQGLYPSALRVILDYLKGAGFERCFICVRDDNVSSIRGIEKAGFRRVGIMKLRKFFGIQVSRRRSMRPSQREF